MRKFCGKIVTLLLTGALVLGSIGTVDANASVSYHLDEAEEIDVNERIDGELTENDSDEYDMYRFTTGKGKITENWYHITFKDMNRQSPNVVGAKLYLYDEDMKEIDSIEASSSSESEIFEKLDNKTDYYIVVTHRTNKGNPCEYYFEVEEREDEAGENVDDAAEISVNKEYKNYFQAPGEYDVYKFKVTADEQKIKVKNCHAKDGVKHDIIWEVLDEDGVAVSDVKDTFWGVTAEESKEYDVKLKPGEYFIRIKGSSNNKHEEESESKYIFSIEEASAKTTAGNAMTLTSLTMSKGDSITLEAFFADKDATSSWSSSKSSVVKVTSSGKLTAKKKGTAKITCKNKKTGEKMVLKVTVK